MKVALLMGSDSDLPRLEPCLATLRELEIDVRGARALRAPHARGRWSSSSSGARARRPRVPLRGRRRGAPRRRRRGAHATCRCSASRSTTRRSAGSTRCSRPCRCRAACRSRPFGAGAGGPVNAALFAARILALSDAALAERVRALPRRAQAEKVARRRTRALQAQARRKPRAAQAPHARRDDRAGKAAAPGYVRADRADAPAARARACSRCAPSSEMVDAIRRLAVRGAPGDRRGGRLRRACSASRTARGTERRGRRSARARGRARRSARARPTAVNLVLGARAHGRARRARARARGLDGAAIVARCSTRRARSTREDRDDLPQDRRARRGAPRATARRC